MTGYPTVIRSVDGSPTGAWTKTKSTFPDQERWRYASRVGLQRQPPGRPSARQASRVGQGRAGIEVVPWRMVRVIAGSSVWGGWGATGGNPKSARCTRRISLAAARR